MTSVSLLVTLEEDADAGVNLEAAGQTPVLLHTAELVELVVQLEQERQVELDK